MKMYDEQHFTHDAAVATFKEDAAGVTVDDNGERTIDWDEVEVVRIDNPPHADAFDTKRFYRLPATVAKPIKQPYHYGEDSLVWLKKPREELKKAAWSLDNAPVTLDHPDTTMVKHTDDIHGFWNDTQYLDGVDDLDSYAHIPVGDEKAKEHVEDNGDVSVGFYNRIARIDEYDGIVGGGDDIEDVDGYQTEMVFDHCAFVGMGRCPSEQGCGLDASPSHGRGHVEVDGSFKYGTLTKDISETGESTVTDSMQETTDAVSVHTPDFSGTTTGEWSKPAMEDFDTDDLSDIDDHFIVSVTEFPPDNYGDLALPVVEPNSELNLNALRNAKARASQVDGLSGDALSRVESTINSLADDNFEDAEFSSDCVDCQTENDTNTSVTIMEEFEINLDDLAAEAAIDRLADQHEGVSEIMDEYSELQELRESVDAVKESIDIDLEDVPDILDELQAKADAFDEIKQKEMEEDAERLAELTDKYEDADEILDAYDEHEDITDRIELLEDVADTSVTTTDSGNEETDSIEEQISGDRRLPDAWTN